MNQKNITPSGQLNQALLPDGAGQGSGAQAVVEDTALRALVEDRTTQLKKAHEDLLHANAELHLAQEQSGRNAEYLQAVLNNSPAAIGFVKAVFDTPDPLHGDPAFDRIIDYRLVAVNEKFALMVGQPIGQLIGQAASRVAGKLWQDDTYAAFYHIIATDAAFYEEREYDEAGQPRWLSLSAVKHDGGIVLTSLDITKLRQTQLQREALRQQANQSDIVIAQLAALRQHLNDQNESLRTTSHDLRSSLGIVQGAAQLLNFAESDAERVEIMEMINRNVKELARLLTELVETSLIEE